MPSCPSCWKPFTPWGQQSFPPPPLAATTLSHPQTLAHRGPHHSLRQAATSPSPALQGKQSFGRWGLEVGVPGSSWGLLAPCCKVLVPGGSPGRGRAAGLGADAWAPTQSCSCRALLHPFVPLPAPPFWFLGGPPWPSWDPPRAPLVGTPVPPRGAFCWGAEPRVLCPLLSRWTCGPSLVLQIEKDCGGALSSPLQELGVPWLPRRGACPWCSRTGISCCLPHFHRLAGRGLRKGVGGGSPASCCGVQGQEGSGGSPRSSGILISGGGVPSPSQRDIRDHCLVVLTGGCSFCSHVAVTGNSPPQAACELSVTMTFFILTLLDVTLYLHAPGPRELLCTCSGH